MDQTLPTSETATPIVVDVAVVGAGPVGALAALAAADVGASVALLAPERAHDPRTSALMMPSIAFLEELGVWPAAASHAAPLQTIRMVDETGYLPRAPEVKFDAHDLGPDPFGYNIPNDALNAALAARLGETGVHRVSAFVERADGLDDGPAVLTAGAHAVQAELVVAADGAQSFVREAAGIRVRRWSYRQSAFVTTLTHERPHGDVSVEFHTEAGPCTLVPLPGERSSLVWVARPDEAARLATLDPGPLAREVERRCHAVLGRMSVDGPRGVIPMDALAAWRLGTGRVVLAGEAGHRFPPIGAQGLNLGIRDVVALRDLVRRALPDRDFDRLSHRYDARRRGDVTMRTASVDILNRSLLTGAVLPSAARAVALSAAANIAPLRRAMMRFGLGA